MIMESQKNVSSDNASTMKPVADLVVPADPNVMHDPQQVTQWVDDTAVQNASLPSIAVPSQDLLDSGTEIRDHNIHDILSRPVKLGDVSWTDSQTADSTPIVTYSFPEDLINASANISNKISHFMFLRAHVVIRFVVNANTFQAGRLVAYFAPFSSSTEIGDRVLVNDFMSARTVFPRVVLDAGSGNSGELTIPYVSYYSHYNLPQGLGDMGKVYLVVLNPLQTGNANVSIFARFTNISLEIPTAVPNTLGSFSGILSRFHNLLSKGYKPKTIFEALEEDIPRAQVGEADSKARVGIVSSVLQAVSGISSSLSSMPLVGKYVTPISWVSKALADAAAYFGLSKPTNLSMPLRLVNVPGYGLTNVDCVDSSIVLGGSCENEIGTRHDVFGSSIDEMDIAFICQHESFLYSFQWTDARAPGYQLTAFNVSPGVAISRALSSGRVYNSTAMAYVASMFEYWRGSIKIKVQVTKTAYHSGRLRVSYVPGGVLPTGMYDYNQGYSEIVDLRTSDEIVFVIPFVSNTMWKKSGLLDFAATGNLAQSTGIVVVEVLNSLRHPDSVTGTLDCNVWISGCDDIQFAIPSFSSYMPCQEDDLVRAYGIEPYELPRAQVLGQFQDVGFNSMTDFSNKMFTSKPVPPIDASLTTIGEHIQNLRQVIKRFGIITSSPMPASAASAMTMNTGYFGPIAKTSQPSSGISNCPIDYVSWLYRFYRGGQRYKMLVDQVSTVGTLIGFNEPAIHLVPRAPYLSAAAVTDWSYIFNTGSAFLHQVNMILNNLLEVLVPYYSNTFISLIRSPTGGTTVTAYDDSSSNVHFMVDSPLAVNATFFKAAADDFSFGWLVGPPKLMDRPALGATATLDFSTGTSLASIDGNVLVFSNVVLTPPLSDGDSVAIVGASASTFNVTLTGGGTMSVPFVGANVSRTGSAVKFSFSVPDATLIDIAASITTINMTPTVTIAYLE